MSAARAVAAQTLPTLEPSEPSELPEAISDFSPELSLQTQAVHQSA